VTSSLQRLLPRHFSFFNHQFRSSKHLMRQFQLISIDQHFRLIFTLQICIFHLPMATDIVEPLGNRYIHLPVTVNRRRYILSYYQYLIYLLLEIMRLNCLTIFDKNLLIGNSKLQKCKNSLFYKNFIQKYFVLPQKFRKQQFYSFYRDIFYIYLAFLYCLLCRYYKI